MEIVSISREHAAQAAPLVADFRVALRSYKGIASKPDRAAGREEMLEYLDAGFPCFAAVEEGEILGYVVCRVDGANVWMESIYVREACRGKGVADRLLERAEMVAAECGEPMLFHYVHPNNDRMMGFLRKHGYTVLNLLEIRKPWPGEKLTRKIRVEHNEFDY